MVDVAAGRTRPPAAPGAGSAGVDPVLAGLVEAAARGCDRPAAALVVPGPAGSRTIATYTAGPLALPGGNWADPLFPSDSVPVDVCVDELPELAPLGLAAASGATIRSFPQGRVAGLLVVLGPDPAPLGSGQLRLLRLLAAQVGVVLAARGPDPEGDPRLLVQLLDNVGDVVSRHAPDGTTLWVSRALTRVLGHSPEDWRARPLHLLVHDDDAPNLGLAQRAALAGRVGHATVRQRHADGRWLWIEATLHPVLDANGEVGELHVSRRDVTGRVVAQERLRVSEERLAAVLEHTDAVVYVKDRDGRYLMANPALGQLLDRPAHTILGCTDVELFPAEVAAALEQADRGVLETGDARDGMELAHADGTMHRYVAHRFPLRGLDGRVYGVAAVATDVTALDAARDALRESEARFRALFATGLVGQAETDTDGRLCAVNPALCQWLGHDQAELVGADLADLAHPEDQLAVRAALSGLRDAPHRSVRLDHRWRHAKGHNLWGSVSLSAVPLASGEPRILVQVQDVTEQKAAQEALSASAVSDPLTGLPNRLVLHDRLRHALAIAQRDRAITAVLLCDLDGLRDVNERFGHASGDEVLVAVANRISAVLRPADTVARVGGDEFVVLCEDLGQRTQARAIARRIAAAVNAPLVCDGETLSLPVSIGISLPNPGQDATQALRDADTALARAKQRGRNGYQVFDATLRSVSSIKQQREEVLRSALAEGRVELHYQPLFRLDDSSSIGVEALARLRDRQGELVMPAAFIPLAEDSGLIVPLGNEVLAQVCRQLAAWRIEGKERFATVNVSARQAARPDLADVVHGALDDAGLNPDALWLELTETALLEASPATLRHLLRLRSLGVRIGIDDFGTGYASLRYLRDLPVDFIKIDRSFVSELTRHRDARAIVGAVARLAGELRLDCVAEGVEEPGQLAVLRDLSVTHVQGFLLGRPVPAAELVAS